MNRKGFTLIELLVTILVISLVLGLSTFGIVSAINSSKEKAATLSLKSVKEGARTYSNEKGEDYWKEGKDNTYFCVTIEELINKGILNKNAKNIEDGVSLENYVVVVKDKVTKVVKKELLLNSNSTNDSNYNEAFSLCTGNIKVEEITSNTKIKENKPYTDTITINFEDATFQKDDEKIAVKERNCYYGKDTSNITNSSNTKIENNNCVIEDLEQNQDYYVKICVTSESNSTSCSDPDNIKTLEISKPSIEVDKKTSVKITYNDDNIYNKEEASYYFKSSSNGKVDNNVSDCTLDKDNNKYTCNNSTTKEITKDKWYKTPNKEIIITYEDAGNIKINAETRDKSNNSSSNEKEFSLYKITFNKGNADSINNQTNNIEEMCLAEKNKKCSITSPSIEKANYNIVGWNTNSDATSSSWNVKTIKNISKTDTYYPILKINTYTLTLNKGTGVSTIYYKVKGTSNYSSSSSNKTISNISGGTIYEYYGVSSTGYSMNSCIESNPCSVQITSNITKELSAEDKTPPIIVIDLYYEGKSIISNADDTNLEILEHNSWLNKQVSVKFTASDDGSGVNTNITKYYSSNNNDYSTLSNLSSVSGTLGTNNIFTEEVTKEGYTYRGIKVCDNANNCTTKYIKFKLDTTPPDATLNAYYTNGDGSIEFTSSGNTFRNDTWLNRLITLELTPSDSLSGIINETTFSYNWILIPSTTTDSNTIKKISESETLTLNNGKFTRSISSPGQRYVTYNICDNAGNCTVKEVYFNLDIYVPTVINVGKYEDTNTRLFTCDSLSGTKGFWTLDSSGAKTSQTTYNSEYGDYYTHWWTTSSDHLDITCRSNADNVANYTLDRKQATGYCGYTNKETKYVNGFSDSNPCSTTTKVCGGTQSFRTNCSVYDGYVHWREWGWVSVKASENFEISSTCINC